MKNIHSGKCDLHIHSIFSDSDTDIEEIFKIAKAKGISALAISDHDTVDGLAKAQQCSEISGVELIEAIEISAQNKDCEVHILGYFINPHNKILKESLANIKELRKERLLSMADKLISLGIDIDKEEVISQLKGAIPTRLHLGLYLVKKGKVSSLWEAFKKYLSFGRPAYVSRFKYSVKEAISLIKEAGGLSFLAHPHFLPSPSWIEEFISFGIDGLEVVYPYLSKAKSSLYKNLADKYSLLKSGGSDAHGSYKEFTEIGGVTIPYRWVEEMKNSLMKIKA
jgi:hypothetical protein